MDKNIFKSFLGLMLMQAVDLLRKMDSGIRTDLREKNFLSFFPKTYEHGIPVMTETACFTIFNINFFSSTVSYIIELFHI